jgi:release factor glutamine methyltransferase
MTIRESLIQGANTLKQNNFNEPCMKISKILLADVLDKDILYLDINYDDNVEAYIQDVYFKCISRASDNEPIEYITNKVSFYDNIFYVDKNVLIPRSESEILIDKVLFFKNKKIKTISEIGVGSGILSITLAKMFKETKFISTDISKSAINIAQKNAISHNVENQITFYHTSLLDNINDDIDIIISNPPYIQDDYKLDKNVLYEPKIALFGGKIGDEILKDIIDIAYIKKTKILICEMGYNQKESLSKYINETYTYISLDFYKDLAGYDRGFVLKLNKLGDLQ